MAGRVILLLVAVVVAALGALLVFVYADRTIAEARQQLEPVEVLVVQQEIAAGTSVAQAVQAGALDLVERPTDALPTGYLVDTADVLEHVTSSAMYPNDILTETRLVEPATLGELSIPETDLAVSFVFGDPNRVAAFVGPGDTVAVFLTRQDAAVTVVDPETGQQSSVSAEGSTQLLLPAARVLAVGSVAADPLAEDAQPQQGEASEALLTLSLSQEDAQRMILAQSLGELYLGLLSEQSVVAPGAGTTPETLFGGGS